MTTMIITATPPTPNGDLHIGHLAGPYLNADVFARYARLRGTDTMYVSFSDHNQTYVVTTAAKTGELPKALADRQADDIRETLRMADIQVDTFHNPDARHDEFVRAFFAELFTQGKLTKKTQPALVNSKTGAHVFEAYLKGYCTVCFSETCGAICEACGHPNDALSIDSPRIALSAQTPLVQRDMELVYLELEPYRERIRSFYQAKKGQWRPHILELVDEILDKPLPDYPVTYRSEWGIPAPFPGCEGQVLNVWAEMFPGLVNATQLVAERHRTGAGSETGWNGASQVVQFLGYDNSFFFAFVHLALCFASEGRYAPPSYIITNEFYELDNFKFSTSKRHVIWARDLLKEVAPDPLRFYLCLSNPEEQKMNFTLEGFKTLVLKRLQAPWRDLIDQLVECLQKQGLARVGLPEAGDTPGSIYLKARGRFEQFYGPQGFSLQRVAENLSQLLTWAAAQAGELHAEGPEGTTATLPALARLAAWDLPIICSPLMPRFAAAVRQGMNLPVATRWDEEPAGLLVEASAFSGLRGLLDL